MEEVFIKVGEGVSAMEEQAERYALQLHLSSLHVHGLFNYQSLGKKQQQQQQQLLLNQGKK